MEIGVYRARFHIREARRDVSPLPGWMEPTTLGATPVRRSSDQRHVNPRIARPLHEAHVAVSPRIVMHNVR